MRDAASRGSLPLSWLGSGNPCGSRPPSAIRERAFEYPVVADNDYKIWSAFANHFWPALYFVDADGVIKDEHFGEGRYEQSERLIQQLLDVEREPASVEGRGVEAAADWDHLRTAETYLGHARSSGFASQKGATFEGRRVQSAPDGLPLNHWALAGEWTIEPEKVVVEQPAGASASGSTRATHTPCCAPGTREPIPFRVRLDGQPPGRSHGVDVDEAGNGVLQDGRMHQLVREHDGVRDRMLELTFLDPGAEAYAFTFG